MRWDWLDETHRDRGVKVVAYTRLHDLVPDIPRRLDLDRAALQNQAIRLGRIDYGARALKVYLPHVVSARYNRDESVAPVEPLLGRIHDLNASEVPELVHEPVAGLTDHIVNE